MRRTYTTEQMKGYDGRTHTLRRRIWATQIPHLLFLLHNNFYRILFIKAKKKLLGRSLICWKTKNIVGILFWKIEICPNPSSWKNFRGEIKIMRWYILCPVMTRSIFIEKRVNSDLPNPGHRSRTLRSRNFMKNFTFFFFTLLLSQPETHVRI